MLFARACPTATVQTERARPYSLTMPSSRQRRGLAFAVKLVAIQIAGSCSYLMRFGRGHQLTRNFQRVLAWTLLSGVVWLAGGVADDAPRVVLWLIAVAVDYTAPMHGFAAPFLGRSLTREWTIDRGYLAERFQLFVITTFGSRS